MTANTDGLEEWLLLCLPLKFIFCSPVYLFKQRSLGIHEPEKVSNGKHGKWWKIKIKNKNGRWWKIKKQGRETEKPFQHHHALPSGHPWVLESLQ